MHLIDDVDLIPSFGRRISYLLADLPDIIDTIVRCGINFDHIHRCAGCDRPTGCAFITRIAIYRMLAVHCPRKDLGHGRLTGTPRATEQICMADPIRLDLVAQCLYDMILSFYIFKCIRAKFSV